MKIPLQIRQVPDGDKTGDSIAFVRGPQVLAADTVVKENGIPDSWWGDTLYTQVVEQNGIEKEFRLVTFADAGQHKEEYTVLHEGIGANDSA